MSKENLSEVTLPTNKRKIETNSWNEDEFLEEVDAEALEYYYDEVLGAYDEDEKGEVKDGYDF